MNAKVQKVVEKLTAHAKVIEFTPSREVLRLYKYNIIPSKMGGLWDQCFTTMTFAEGDARQLNCYMLFSQLRLVDNDLFGVPQLKALFRDTVPISAEFLSTCGFEELWADTKEVLAVLDLIDNKADYKELISAYCFYVTNLHNWIHFYFPWYVGEFFPQRKLEDVKEMEALFNL